MVYLYFFGTYLFTIDNGQNINAVLKIIGRNEVVDLFGTDLTEVKENLIPNQYGCCFYFDEAKYVIHIALRWSTKFE